MYKISEEFKNSIYSGDASGYEAKLTINGKEVPSTQIASITISMPIFDDSAQIFYIGTIISNKITIKFKNLDNLEIVTGNHVHLEIGKDINGEIEYVPMGEYLIDTLAEDYQKTCQIDCMDYLIKMKPNLDIRGAFTDGKTTVDNLLKWICDFYELELGTYPNINGDVETSVYDNSVSGKGWLSYIAEIKGSNVKMSRDNKVMLIPFKQEPATTIDALHTTSSLTIGEKYQITQVTYYDAIRNFTFGEDTGNTLFIRQDNPFIQDGSIIENIYNAVNGMTIYPISYKTSYGNVAIDPYDVINITTDTDESGNLLIYPIYNNCTITFDQDIVSDIEVKIPTKQTEATTNVVKGDTRTQINRVRTEVDNLQQQITMQASTTTNIQNSLNSDYYTINQVNTLVETATNGLTNTYTTSGGNNIFRNTGLWFEEKNNFSNLFSNTTLSFCNKDIETTSKKVDDIYKVTDSVTNYVRSTNLIGIPNGTNTVNIQDTSFVNILEYDRYLIEIDANKEIQYDDNGEVIKHLYNEAGTYQLTLKSGTAYLLLLLVYVPTYHSIEVGDNLTGKEVVTSFPKGFFKNEVLNTDYSLNKILGDLGDTVICNQKIEYSFKTYCTSDSMANYKYSVRLLFDGDIFSFDGNVEHVLYNYSQGSDDGEIEQINNIDDIFMDTNAVTNVDKNNPAYKYIKYTEDIRQTTIEAFADYTRTLVISNAELHAGTYEYWNGEVARIKEEKASNLNALSLLNGTVSQNQNVTNGKYTISFKYKKLIELANASVIINGVEEKLDSTNDTTYTKTIDVAVNNIEIDFVCDVDNGCEIYDLMVNTGDSAMIYAQNQNETTTDTVNISKGITITSSDTNTTFKANSDGSRIYNNDNLNEPVTEFTDQGTKTKNLSVNEKAIIGNLLIEDVDEQTWIARL